MKGTCTGTGKIQLRLNPGESVEQVELNFARKGVMVRASKNDPRKRPNMTGAPKEFASEITNTKDQKQKFLESKNNNIFGGAGSYQVQ